MERRKFVVGLGALAAGTSAAVGSGAFTAAELSGREAEISIVDDTDGLIGLEAGSSELVNDEGGAGENQLAIDFDVDGAGDGVNPNSTYQVGGLGGAVGDLTVIPGSPSVSPNADEVAIDKETDIEEEFAFELRNQSGSDQAVELTYEANEDFPADTVVYMVSYTSDLDSIDEQRSALSAAATPDDREASILYANDADFSEDLGPGAAVQVSIIVDVGDVDMGETDLGGELIVRAGSHDENEFIDQ